MNNYLLKTLAIVGIFLCAACSTYVDKAVFTPATADPDQAVVYIYRPSVMSNALYSPGINIDGEFKLYAKNGINSRLVLTPGEHKFEFQADKDFTELLPVTLSLDAGSIAYIRVSTSLEIDNSVGYKPYARSFSLNTVDEVTAVKEIAECCTAKAVGSRENNQTGNKEKQTGDGFSVDKTQNPFSH